MARGMILITIARFQFCLWCQKFLKGLFIQQLVDYLESRDLFSRYPCGFCRKYSTQTAIPFLTNSIRRNMDAGLLRGAIFVDFCMVFDTIDHNILLDKLQLFGICGSEHLDGFRVISLTVSNLFLWEVFCPVLNKLFLKFRKVLYWVCCYFHCMSLTYQTVCKLLMC